MTVSLPQVSPQDHAPAEGQALAQRLRGKIRGELYIDPVHRGMYATDASHYQMMPAGVVTPRDEADVIEVVAAARELGLPLIGRGGGTSLAGQTFGSGIVLDFTKYMNQVVEVNADERWARVQPGVVRDQLNRATAARGLHFAPDPATTSRATLGGMIANNSSGMHSILHGKTIDHVIELKVLLSDGTICTFGPCDAPQWQRIAGGTGREAEIYRGVGKLIASHREEIIRRFPKVMRRVGGYNLDEFVPQENLTLTGQKNPALKGPAWEEERNVVPGEVPGEVPGARGQTWNLSKLICGSEGTLGLVLEAKVRLEPLPGAAALCVVHFDDLLAALEPLPVMLEHKPAAVELLDEIIVRESKVNASTRGLAGFFVGEPRAVLIVEFWADTPAQAAEQARDFAQDMQARGIGSAHVLRTEPAAMREVWELRRLGVGLQSNVPGRRKPLDFVDDACLPVAKLAEYIRRLRDVCRAEGVAMPVSGHASVGVLHPKPMLDMLDEGDRRIMQRIADAAFALVVEYGGSWCGEHGDGLVRGQYVRPFFGDALYGAFQKVKRLFDPAGLMNPGKIIDTPGMTEHLRHGAADYDKHCGAVRAMFHYRTQGGFAAAVEQCNGVGACRKIGQGTMCPSYMATRDEDASTRGRANALRLAMSGQLPPAGLTDDGVAQALELCLSCKACKSECPNAVDMSKLKADVLQMRHDRFGLPLGARLIGNSPQVARRLAGPMAPVVNAVQQLKPYKWMLEKWTGLDRRRTYPTYARKTLQAVWQRELPTEDGRPVVVLFDDTYMRYHEPEVGLSARELLEGCGYRVVLAQAGCCQRPRLSQGMLREAKRDGTVTMRNLLPYAERGWPIVCTEPSCASALMDDLPDLIDDAGLGRTVAGRVQLLDVFLAEELASGRVRVRLTSPAREIVLHGHCHQKSLAGGRGLPELLRRVEGLTVSEVDTGCCGMAGAFGYEHYDLSWKIGEERLFPAVRTAAARGAAVCASGFSCRHQVREGCGVEAKHFVQLLRGTKQD